MARSRLLPGWSTFFLDPLPRGSCTRPTPRPKLTWSKWGTSRTSWTAPTGMEYKLSGHPGLRLQPGEHPRLQDCVAIRLCRLVRGRSARGPPYSGSTQRFGSISVQYLGHEQVKLGRYSHIRSYPVHVYQQLQVRAV